MIPRSSALLILLSALSPAGHVLAQEHDPPPAPDASVEHDLLLDPEAGRILQSMCELLARQPALAFRSEHVYDAVEPDGQKLQFTRRAEIGLQRPARLRGSAVGDGEWNRAYWYDGKRVTVLDRAANMYSQVEVPDTIDGMFDHMYDTYGLALPISDLLVSDPHSALATGVETGRLIGKATVGGYECYHLAFTQPVVDWQLWVDAGDKPLPRKLVITYKEAPSSPQFTAIFLEWNLQPTFDEAAFTFEPPAGAQQIELAPAPAEDDASDEDTDSATDTTDHTPE